MAKQNTCLLLVILTLTCIGITIYEYFYSSNKINPWSLDIVGVMGVHSVFIIFTSFKTTKIK